MTDGTCKLCPKGSKLSEDQKVCEADTNCEDSRTLKRSLDAACTFDEENDLNNLGRQQTCSSFDECEDNSGCPSGEACSSFSFGEDEFELTLKRCVLNKYCDPEGIKGRYK